MELIKQKLNLGAFSIGVLAMFFYGTNAVALKIATESMDPLVFAALRGLMIGIILLCFVSAYKKIFSAKNLLRILPGAILLTLFTAFYALGVSESGALKASIFSLTMPVFLYLFAVILLHEPVIKRIMFGGVIAISGSLLLIGLPLVLGQGFQLGDVYLLIAYASVAAAAIHGKYMFRWLTPNELLSIRFFLGGFFLTLYILFFMEPGAFLVGEATAWLLLLHTIVITGIVGNTLYYRALSKMKAEQSAPLFYIDPMTGTLLAALLLGERLDVSALVGVAVIVLGVSLSYPHHNHVLHNYLHPRKHRVRRVLYKLMHPIKG
jgi:drug/metabolite transporter, DME family